MPVRDLMTLAGIAEPISALTHLAGVLVVLIGGVILLRRGRGDTARTVSLAIAILGAANLFFCSGIYHFLDPGNPLRSTFWHLDHAAVWIVCATTYTPVMVLLCPRRWRRIGLVVMWGIALAGATVEVALLKTLPHWVSPLLYIGMGWFVLFPTLMRVMSIHGFWYGSWLLWAGCFATVGGLMDSFQQPMLWPGVIEAHELHHLCALMGAILSWPPIYRAADGSRRPDF